MQQYLPQFIIEHYLKEEKSGTFDTISMFVDITGFTRMTESLMLGGEEGAEILSDILNRLFYELIDTIYANGGFISTFAGDAFTTLFLSSSAERVLQCAFSIIERVKAFGIQRTKFGIFTLQVRIGIADGKVEWGIVGDHRHAYFFRGDSIELCVQAQHLCNSNDIVIGRHFATQLHHLSSIELEKLSDEYYHVVEIPKGLVPERKKLRASTGVPAFEVVERFYPDSVLNFDEQGEFRNAVPIFISFAGIENTEELDTFISIVMDHCIHYGGYFNKIDYGDKGGLLLCVFGAPIAYENNVERALDFILAVKSDVVELPVLKELVLRVGITYGRVYAGIIGSPLRSEYTVIGDIVNLAARLMMRANADEILLTERIHRYTQHHYSMDYLGKYTVRGKSKPVPVFQLNKAEDLQQSLFEGSMIGRAQEMTILLDFARSHYQNRQGSVISVFGEAGMGKSRLAYEFRRQIQREMSVVSFVCPSDQNLKKPFNPFISFLRKYFEISSEKSLAENRDIMSMKLRRMREKEPVHADKSLYKQLVEELIHSESILGALIGLHWDNSLYDELNPQRRYAASLAAVTQLIHAECCIRPVLLEIEDGHWLDNDSLTLIQYLLKNVMAMPLLFMITSRYRDDGQKPDFQLKTESMCEIDLAPLPVDELKDLAEKQLGGEISQSLFLLLYEKSNANPFYAQQFLHYFIENKLIEQADNTWLMKSKEHMTLPETIHEILIARIDRMSQQVKETVKIASVLGTEFEINILVAVLRRLHKSSPDKKIYRHLRVAENEKIWSSMMGLKYIFSHVLLRDAAYNMQLKEKLRYLHRLVAETIEEMTEDEQKRHYYVDLALHYELGGVPYKTIEYLEKAADFAKSQFLNDQAIELYDKLLLRASELDGMDVVIIDTSLKKGAILRMMARWDDVLPVYQMALEKARKIDDSKRTGLALNALGWLVYLQGKYDDASGYFTEALSLFSASGSEKEYADAIGNLGLVHYKSGRYEEAMDCFEQQLKVGEKMDYKQSVSIASGQIGNVLQALGNTDEALKWYKKDLETSQAIGDKAGIAISYGNIAYIHQINGENKKALTFYEKAITLAQELEMKYYLSRFYTNKAELLLEFNSLLAADTLLNKAITLAKEVQRQDILFYARYLQSKSSFIAGHLRQSYETLLTLSAEDLDSPDKALIHYEFFNIALTLYEEQRHLTKNEEHAWIKKFINEAKEHHQEAVLLYSRLTRLSPKKIYRQRLAELETSKVPGPVSLP